MRKKAFATLLVLMIATAATLACDNHKTKTKAEKVATSEGKKAQPAPSEQKGGVLLTGSYIKQNVKVNGQITDSHNQLIILDRDTVRNSGASDLRQLLTRQGVH